jgi:hypothetical protein
MKLMTQERRSYYLILAVFLLGGLAMQLVPYISKSQSIDWGVAFGK